MPVQQVPTPCGVGDDNSPATVEWPAASVVIPARDAATTLGEALAALATQDYPGWWEVLVVAGGSTDATAALARTYADRLPRLTVLEDALPAGAAAAQNRGIAASRGDVLVFLDADDVVEPGYLLAMGRALATRDFVAGRLDLGRLNAPEAVRRQRPLQSSGLDVFCGWRPAVVGAAMGARRTVVEQLGGFDEELTTQQDLDLSWRLMDAGHDPLFVRDAVVQYRYRATPASVFRQQRSYGEGEVRLFRKHHAEGMPRRTVLQVGASYVRLARAALGLRTPAGRMRCATMAGLLWGRLRGSITQRTLYL
ncbi:glycosyltransferase involved in cell wall biosynthesis [Friedmanniella endophytica]|uniref:Glycosyltransferase involved in cell wall biosynthesis n=1 Tax=Microlunatus kandeliicorticis TaxID=1759536 RepID=A0A7W3P7N4_9ACTN|nr:glycosyltransferase [Microlunatus kandeliicorticis]MBA8796137.1 glycosyltransferase involved in cell wall biosynthesis [Microlunatus kandeliicorticis]